MDGVGNPAAITREYTMEYMPTIIKIGTPESSETKAIRDQLSGPIDFETYKELMAALEASF